MIYAEKVVGKDGRLWIKVSFRYLKEAVNAMARVKGAIYSPEKKLWAVPYENREDFERKMGQFLIVWKDEEPPNNGGIDESTIPEYPIVPGYTVTYDEDGNVVDAEGFKTKPWGEFQVKGFNLLVSRRFLILADDAGLGKSWQVSTAIEAKKRLGQLKRGLVVCKASLVYNWRDEIHMHTNERAICVVGTQQQRHRLYSDLTHRDDWTFLVISYETFREDIANLMLLHTSKPLDFCVLDEAHKVKNPKSKIGLLIHQIDFRFRYVLTATPLPNTPLEAYNYLKFGKVINMNPYQFEHRYAIKGGYGGKEIVGYKNIDELRKLIQTNMLRRRKEEKLKELPAVTFKTITIKMTPEQERIYKAVKEEILEELKDTNLDNIPSALTKLLRLQQVTDSIELVGAKGGKNSSAKLNALDELLEDLIDEGGEKVIVFSRFKEMVNILANRYQKYNPAVIHGDVDASGMSEASAIRLLRRKYGDAAWASMPQEEKNRLIDELTTSDRQKQVYKFQNDDTCKLFIGCSPACREGLTLTKATHVIFVDCEWSPAYVEQAYSRAHRIGQRNNVTVYFLVCEGTIDEHVQKVLKQKESMSQMMIDQGIQNVGALKAREFISLMIGS